MKKIILILFLMSISIGAQVETRTLNNGNLILEDVPIVPEGIKKELKGYQNTRSASFRGFKPDNEGVFISTRFGDVGQLHVVDKPLGMRKQVTFFDEPIGSVSVQPNGELIAFTMDSGGSENAQIYVMNPENGRTVLVSDGESRNGSVLWSRGGEKIAFGTTRRNGASNDVWIMDYKYPEQAKMVFASPDGTSWTPADWSKDSSKILLQNYISVTSSRIFIVDTQTGESELVSNNEDSSNLALAFGASGRGFFFLTDQFGQFRQLAYKSLTNGRIKIISEAIPWNIEGFAISKDRKKAAFTANEGGFSVLYLMDARSFKFKKVEMKNKGLIGGIKFSDDGKKLGLSLNNAKSPSETHIVNLGKRNLDYLDVIQWTESEVGGLNTDEFVQPNLISFKSFDNLEVPAFIYKPKDVKEPVPVIITIHGGPESQYRPRFSSSIQQWVKRLGAAVIAPNVRGSNGYGKEYLKMDNGFKREDSVKDIGALLDWVKTQPDLDSDRVAVIGGSYGGYMVLASAVYYSDQLIGAVDRVGISNFVTFLKNTEDYRRDLRRVEYGDERDPEMRAFLEKISPNNNVAEIDIPMLVIQGENDPRVPVTESEQVVEALRKEGKTVWYMNALNEGHGFRKKENSDVSQQVTLMFFEKYL